MRSFSIVAVAAATALVLTACSPSYDDDTRDGLRTYVVTVSEASAAGDWQTAIGALDGMVAEVEAARQAGKLDDERFKTITLAMELVRQDLETAVAAAEDAAERQRLQDEQARLEQQIAELQQEPAPVDREPGGDGGGKEKDKKQDKDEGGGKGDKKDR